MIEEQLAAIKAVAARHSPKVVREAQSEAEAAAIWLGRKSAFGAMGQLGDYICLDGTVPTSALPQVLRRIGESGFLKGFMQASAWGTPDDVLKTLEARRKLLGAFELATSFRFGGIPYAKAEQSLRLFAKEVLPVLKGWDKAAERRRSAAA